MSAACSRLALMSMTRVGDIHRTGSLVIGNTTATKVESIALNMISGSAVAMLDTTGTGADVATICSVVSSGAV